jgi:hypothetical protein
MSYEVSIGLPCQSCGLDKWVVRQAYKVCRCGLRCWLVKSRDGEGVHYRYVQQVEGVPEGAIEVLKLQDRVIART